MSLASDFREAATQATIYQVMGQSGAGRAGRKTTIETLKAWPEKL